MLKWETKDLFNSEAFQDAHYYKPHTQPMHEMLIRPLTANSSYDHTGLSAAHQIESIISQFFNITALLPAHSPNQQAPITHSRQRRFFPVIIAGIAGGVMGGLLGTFMGQYSQKQISSITTLEDLSLLLHVEDEHQHLLDNLSRRVNSALTIMNWENRVDLPTRASVWNGVIAQLQHRLTQFVQFVTELQRHRLSMTWFSAEQLQKLHEEVVKQAKNNNLAPLTQYLSDYSQLEVSYLYSENEILAFLHVPASASEHIWTIYRYIPFPIPATNSSMLVITAPQDIIAVGANNRHKIMSQSQFDQCQKRNHHFVCEMPLVTNTDFATSCAGALMDHNSEAIQQHCSLRHLPLQEQVFQTATNQFAIFSPQTYTARGHCINGTTISALVSSTASVTIPSGCSLKLRQHSITVPVNIITTLVPWVQETKWDTFEVSRRLLQMSLDKHATINEILRNDSTLSQDFQENLLTSITHLKAAHSTLSTQLLNAKVEYSTRDLVFTIAMVILVIALCTCLCCRYRNATQPPFQHVPMNNFA